MGNCKLDYLPNQRGFDSFLGYWSGGEVKKLNTGGPQIVWIQTVRFHYCAVNFLVPKFYSEISAIPRNSAIFGSPTIIYSNSSFSNSTQNFLDKFPYYVFEDPL